MQNRFAMELFVRHYETACQIIKTIPNFVQIKKTSEEVSFIYARRDCLDSFALNGTTHFVLVVIPQTKFASPSAHSSLEPQTKLSLSGFLFFIKKDP